MSQSTRNHVHLLRGIVDMQDGPNMFGFAASLVESRCDFDLRKSYAFELQQNHGGTVIPNIHAIFKIRSMRWYLNGKNLTLLPQGQFVKMTITVTSFNKNFPHPQFFKRSLQNKKNLYS